MLVQTKSKRKAAENWLPGAQRDNNVMENDDGHGAIILSRKSQDEAEAGRVVTYHVCRKASGKFGDDEVMRDSTLSIIRKLVWMQAASLFSIYSNRVI